jgi:uncharacterized protein (DUF697 family)
MERKFMTSTMISQIKSQASSILGMVQTTTRSSRLRSAIAYLALSVSFVAAIFALIPVLVMVGGIVAAHRLEEE